LNERVEALIDLKEAALERAAHAEALVQHKDVVIREMQNQIAIERDEKEKMQANYEAQFEQAAGEWQEKTAEWKNEIKEALRERDQQASNFTILHGQFLKLMLIIKKL
jgi:hypothetical protein